MCLKPDTLTESRRLFTALSVMKSSPVTHRYTAAVPNDHALRLPHPAVWEVQCGRLRDEGHGPVIRTHSASFKPETPGLFSFFSPPFLSLLGISFSPWIQNGRAGFSLKSEVACIFCAPIRVLHRLNGKSEGAPKNCWNVKHTLKSFLHFSSTFCPSDLLWNTSKFSWWHWVWSTMCRLQRLKGCRCFYMRKSLHWVQGGFGIFWWYFKRSGSLYD